MATFAELGVAEELCAALRRQGIVEATPVQERVIPVGRSGRDLIVQAQTGTGKTLAFLLPIFARLKAGAAVAQALVVAPTRELALQTAKVAGALGEAVGISSLVIYGGQDIERQKQRLRRHPQLIIGTPGRLLDHLRRRTIDISKVNKVVLDEADEMLRRGFIEDVGLLVGQTAADRQLMLFSATMPEKVRALVQRHMKDPVHIVIKSEQVTLANITQAIVNTSEETKLDQLCGLINKYQPYLAMVFCQTRQRAAQVAMALATRGYLADELHGDLTQLQRTLVLKKFRSAALQILVVTDIAARGLDIEGITHIFNYDMPRDTETYIHRIGRTGRAGQAGMAITFVNSRQYDHLRRLEAGIRQRLAWEHSGRKRAKPAKPAKPLPPVKHSEPSNGRKKQTSPKATRRQRLRRGSGEAMRPAKAARRQGRSKTNIGHRAKL